MLVDRLPGNPTFRFELAETLLVLGHFERGWREYHHRYGMPHTAKLERKVQKPRWDDGRPIPGRTLLIHDEQGYGDTFPFMRMVPWAKERSRARVVLQINADQRRFAGQLPGIDEILLRGARTRPGTRRSACSASPRAAIGAASASAWPPNRAPAPHREAHDAAPFLAKAVLTGCVRSGCRSE